jgi:hypothetical protein
MADHLTVLFNCIYIIQSLLAYEEQTGYNLADSIIKHRSYKK